MFGNKVKKETVKQYCDDMNEYINSRLEKKNISKGEKESLITLQNMVTGLLERMGY